MQWRTKRRLSPVRKVLGSAPVKGAIVGLCATQALDWLSTVIYEREDPALRREENRTRGNLHAYERAVEKLTTRMGLHLGHQELETWGWRFHKAFGILGGIQYVMARRANPKVSWGGGLGFGTAFYLVADELLMPLLRLTPGPQASPGRCTRGGRPLTWRTASPRRARRGCSTRPYPLAAERGKVTRPPRSLPPRGLQR